MSQFIEMTTRSELNKKSIGEIAEVRTGSTPSRSNPEYWNGTHYWVSAQDMGNKYIYDTLEKITDKGYATCKVVPAGSILYVCRGSIGVMSINTMDCATNQSICTATCKKGYNTEYLYYALKVAEKTIKKQGIGTSFKSLNQSAFSSIEILFPAIEIQDKFAAIAKQADKSKFGDFKSQFIEMYHKTHNTQTLESVCAIISKGITPKYVDFSSVAVVNQACIQWDGQHLENIKYHNEEILFKKRTLQTGDVLLNATGTGTLGRCCVFNCPSNDNIYINDGHVIALATDKSILLPEVLKAYLSLNDTQAEIYRLYVTGSTNQVDIVFSDIKKMKVPVPDIDDQISFVKILNQADKSKSYVRIALKNLESILGYCIRQVA